MTRKEHSKALRAHPQVHYNCAQAVLIPFAGDMGLTEEQANALTLNFGAGAGRGAASGALSPALVGRGGRGGVGPSQCIPNVPAALRRSGFTDNGTGLLLGVNLGGLGTLIASMASLISYKYIARPFPEKKGKYLGQFTALNVAFLAVLLLLWFLIR